MERIKLHTQRVEQLEHDIRRLYEIVWGQCTESMRSKVEMFEGFAKVKAERNVIELLKIIRMVSYGFESHKDRMLAYVEALKRLVNFHCQVRWDSRKAGK